MFFILTQPTPRSTLVPTRRSCDLGHSIEDRSQGKGCTASGERRHACTVSEPRCRKCGGRVMWSRETIFCFADPGIDGCAPTDRKSTRLNSSHPSISYAVFCLKKKT